MISCIRWIPKGVAKSNPVRQKVSNVLKEERYEEDYEEEYGEDDEKEGNVNIMEEEIERIPISELPDELKMDEYSEDDEEMNEGEITMSVVSSEEDYKSDEEDLNIKEDDALLLVAKSEGNFATLEVRVYDTSTSNLYVHHDIILESYPLCLAHSDYLLKEDGNYCAVGTFSPRIEIWDLDVINPLEPSLTLSGHSDTVMSLSWNKIHRQILASGSSDTTVKLWDINSKPTSPVTSFNHHKDKVQSLEWHPSETSLLASGSYDRWVFLLDARHEKSSQKLCKLSADCEAIAWDYFNNHLLTVASEDALINTYDIRYLKKEPYISFCAEEMGGISDLCYNPSIKGMLATSSIDGTVTIWNTNNISSAVPAPAPTFITSKDMNVGKLFTVSFYPSMPWLLASGGSGNVVALWHLDSDDNITHQFSSPLEQQPQPQHLQIDEILNTPQQSLEQPAKEIKKKKKKKRKKKVHKA